MAAAHLGNTIPYMRSAARELHMKASKSLKAELQAISSGGQKTDRTLLSLLLVGLTACWQRSDDLGLPYFRAARSLIYPRLSQDNSEKSEEVKRQDQFFEEAMIYWEMLMAFVSHEPDIHTLHLDDEVGILDQEDDILSSFDNSDHMSGLTPKIVPHPWTGVNPQTQVLLAEVGRLIRHERLTRGPDIPSTLDSSNLRLAHGLENDLLAVSLPSIEELVDPGDPYTEKQHLITIAEATRCAGLLELYRVFPKLLESRLRCVDNGILSSSNANWLNWSTPGFPSMPDSTTHLHSNEQIWLTCLAIHLLHLLEMLPATSGIRPQQLLLLLIGGAELRFMGMHATDANVNDLLDIDLQVGHARDFAKARLGQLAIQLPNQPVQRIIDVITEVWNWFDNYTDSEDADIFWLDSVMVRNGWQTMFG